MSFPTTPSYIGQKWLDGGRVWQWNGSAWQAANNSVFWEEIAGKPTYMSGSTIVSTSAPANPIPGLQWWNPTADRIFIWEGSAWVEPNTSTTYPWDTDAVDYIYRVEAADGQELEKATRQAINKFVTTCKEAAIWSAIKASCIMVGARTLAGALTPLVGAAPTNFNFAQADYDRKIGLKGNASNKRIDSNRPNNADPQDSNHNAVYVTDFGTPGVIQYFIDAGINQILKLANGTRQVALRRSNGGAAGGAFSILGFGGLTRNNGSTLTNRFDGVNSVSSSATILPNNTTLKLFSNSGGGAYSSARMSFYSIGEDLDLALLDARVSTLMSDLQTSIP